MKACTIDPHGPVPCWYLQPDFHLGRDHDDHLSDAAPGPRARPRHPARRHAGGRRAGRRPVPDGPEYQVPDVGECRQLTYEAYLGESDTSDVVDCDRAAHVVRRGDRAAAGDAGLGRLDGRAVPRGDQRLLPGLGGPPRRVPRRPARCRRTRWPGSCPPRSSATTVPAGSDATSCCWAAAGCCRCPSDTAPVLDTDLPASVARCLTGEPAGHDLRPQPPVARDGRFPAADRRLPHPEGVPAGRRPPLPGADLHPSLALGGPGQGRLAAGHRTMVCHSRLRLTRPASHRRGLADVRRSRVGAAIGPCPRVAGRVRAGSAPRARGAHHGRGRALAGRRARPAGPRARAARASASPPPGTRCTWSADRSATRCSAARSATST